MAEEKKSFFARLREGLTKTRNNIVKGFDSVFSGYSVIDDEFYEELEETMIMGDLGGRATEEILDRLKEQVNDQGICDPQDCREILIDSIREQMSVGELAYEFENRTSVVLVIGVLMLVYGSGRGKKGFGKVTGLVSAVYNGVTGFFSDILSYVRLMALMLSGAVLAQVFNMLGATTGNVVGFVVIALIGNALNLALNLLGCYVHDMRLQFLEFFGRFYKEGGKGYRPLSVETQYVEVMKEDN